ncbi:MAG: tRNA lysidine(34) synthetase TilS [Pseudomonadota bacterium]
MRPTRLILTTACVSAFLAMTPVSAPAQSTETLADIRQELSVIFVEIQQLNRELSTTGGVGSVNVGGTVLDRVAAIEVELQRLTQKTEQLEFRIESVVRDGTNRLGDLEFRLCEVQTDCDIATLEPGQLLGGVAPSGAAGTGVSSGAGSEAPALPGGEAVELAVGEQTDFDAATALLEAGSYSEAATQFERFQSNYPGSPLGAQAGLRRGEAMEASGDLTGAARVYLDTFSAAPQGPMAAEALFLVGRSLGRLGKTQEACLTLGEVPLRFPSAGCRHPGTGRKTAIRLRVSDQEALLVDRIAVCLIHETDRGLGVAVSGGSDSLALLVLLAEWAKTYRRSLYAATVDHGLRPGSGTEAEYVAEICANLGVPHETLLWKDKPQSGNVSDLARRARYQLLADWASRHNVGCVAVAHTMNDQAETFLMRLGREAGVDGLAAMAGHWRQGSIVFCRPALKVSREELRGVLIARDIPWIDDPTNTDPAYDRARARVALGHLSELGITARSLSRVAEHLAEVRTSLYWYVFLAAQTHMRFQSGDVFISRKGFRTLTQDVSRRLLQKVLMWISGAEYSPRGRAMDLMLEAIRGGTGMTLQGCVMSVLDEELHFTREERAVAETRVTAGEIWDDRWRLEGPDPSDHEIAALGRDGLTQCPDWRASGLPEVSLRAGPAVWRGGHVVAAPLAGWSNGWNATLLRDKQQFYADVLAH